MEKLSINTFFLLKNDKKGIPYQIHKVVGFTHGHKISEWCQEKVNSSWNEDNLSKNQDEWKKGTLFRI